MASIEVLIRRKPDRHNLMLYFVNPLTGREESKSAKTADEKLALRAAATWEQELCALYKPSQTDWDGFRNRFESEHTAGLSDKSQSSYGTALNHFEKLMGKPTDMAVINASVVSQFKGRLRELKIAETSIATQLGHFRSALKWAASVGIIAMAPTVKLPKTGKRWLGRGRAITDEEFAKLLKAVPSVVGKEQSAEWIRLLRGLYLGGFRIEESLRLSWSSPPCQVDLEGGRFPRIIWYAEGHKARRDEVTPMTPDFVEFLRKTPDTRRIGPLFSPVLTDWTMNAEVARKTIAEIGKKSKIVVSETGKFVTAQDLRRSFGKRWAMKVRPMTLKALMRHADITTTLKYYVDIHCEDVGDEIWGVPKNVPAGESERKSQQKKAPKNTG